MRFPSPLVGEGQGGGAWGTSMPREFSRSSRIADQVQRELGELLRELTRDAKLGLVTVTEVNVSPDLSHANIFVSVLGAPDDGSAALSLLHGQAGALRHALGRVMRLKKGAPHLHFKADKLPETAQRLTSLIDRAVAEDRSHHGDD